MGVLQEFPALFGNHEGESSFVGSSQLEDEPNLNHVNANDEVLGNRQTQNSPRSNAPRQKNNRSKIPAVNARNSSKPITRGKPLKQLKCDRCEYTTKYKSELQEHSIKRHMNKQFNKFLTLLRSELRRN